MYRHRWNLVGPTQIEISRCLLHTGRWQPTPFAGSLTETFRLLTVDLAALMGSVD